MLRIPRVGLVAAGLTLALAAGSTALAGPPPGKGKNKNATASQSGGSSLSVDVRFEEARRVAVEHGFVGYEALPPGIRKNLARGKPLPPGIAKKQVPAPVLDVLPAPPDHEWRVCGADLVLVAKSSGIVAELAVDFFR